MYRSTRPSGLHKWCLRQFSVTKNIDPLHSISRLNTENLSVLRLYIFLSVALFSCKGQTIEKKDFDALPVYHQEEHSTGKHLMADQSTEPDSASVQFLLSPSAQKQLNSYWIQKFKTIGDYRYVGEDDLNIHIADHWTISDSVYALVVNYSAGTGSEELLVSIKEKNKFISILRVSDLPKRNFESRKYNYIQFKKVDSRNLELYKVAIIGPEDKESIEKNTELWTIKNNGLIKRSN